MRRETKNRTGIYIAVFIGAIMVLSVIGFMTTEQTGKYYYKKYAFSQKNGQWITNIEEKDFFFDYLPQEVESIEIPDYTAGFVLNSRMVYITYASNETEVEQLAKAQYSLGADLQNINIYSVNAFTDAKDTGFLQIDCKNATQYVPVILIEKAYENSINLNNNCIILKGNPAMVADRLKYAVFGVIK